MLLNLTKLINILLAFLGYSPYFCTRIAKRERNEEKYNMDYLRRDGLRVHRIAALADILYRGYGQDEEGAV
jgi:hypothetical protein